MSALGIGAEIYGELPELSAMAEAALHCYAWSDGWHPERWPVYAALYPVEDWDAMSEMMRAIRDEQREGERRG